MLRGPAGDGDGELETPPFGASEAGGESAKAKSLRSVGRAGRITAISSGLRGTGGGTGTNSGSALYS